MPMKVVLLKSTKCPHCVAITRPRGPWKYTANRPENVDLTFEEYYMDEGDAPTHIQKADPEVGYPEVVILDDSNKVITSCSRAFPKAGGVDLQVLEETIKKARAKYTKKGG